MPDIGRWLSSLPYVSSHSSGTTPASISTA